MARAYDLARLGPVYEQAGFGARLAKVVGFARARLGGEVVVAEAGGELVGVAAGAVFDGTGWVGGVAVVPASRRLGLGGALTEAVVAFLQGRGATTVLLHATDLGRPVYERLGFVPDGAYLTLVGPTRPPGSPGPAGPGAGPAPAVRPGRAADLEAVLAAGGDELAVSVPAANPAAVRFLRAAGFSERFRTLRMRRGPRVPWDPTALFGAHNLFWG